MDTDWREWTSCRGQFDPELCFPAARDAVLKKCLGRVCAGCVVRRQCAAFAFFNGEHYGVWGGVDAAYYRSRQLLAAVAGEP